MVLDVLSTGLLIYYDAILASLAQVDLAAHLCHVTYGGRRCVAIRDEAQQ